MSGAGSRSLAMGGRRRRPDFARELYWIKRRQVPVCGIDEAGRGPWAGPVVAAAVIVDIGRLPNGIDDSKRLSPAARERLHDALMATAQVGIGIADVERIERDNILAASLWAMAEAVAALPGSPMIALVDGNRPPSIDCRVETIVGGDGLSLSIAAASIIAKVTRDRLMVEHADRYPGYGFERHKGYGTAEHAAALARLGPAAIHRRSFKPVAAVIDAAVTSLRHLRPARGRTARAGHE